jgi:AraC family transcriptional regulator, transcriptional activator of pobA
LCAGSFYFTLPGHLKSFDIVEPLEGFLLTFTEAFIKQHLPNNLFDVFPFLINETIPVMQLQQDSLQEIQLLFQFLLSEYQSKHIYKKEILSNQLSVVLYKTKDLLQSHQISIKASGRSTALLQAFQLLMHNNFKELQLQQTDKMLSIKEMANQLHVYPNYLSNVVKTESGKSAIDFINDRTNTEIKSLLMNSEKSISEIAYTFGFTDSTHFSKFFEKLLPSYLIWNCALEYKFLQIGL